LLAGFGMTGFGMVVVVVVIGIGIVMGIASELDSGFDHPKMTLSNADSDSGSGSGLIDLQNSRETMARGLGSSTAVYLMPPSNEMDTGVGIVDGCLSQNSIY
jgi:hypothetical protein